ncbi:ribonuclease H-like domain-containing protein [Tanacetum coccineum]
MASQSTSRVLFSSIDCCDNVSAVYMSANPIQHQRTTHIEIDIHFVCDMVTAGQRVLHVPSRYQYADIFTKGLLSAMFEEFWSTMQMGFFDLSGRDRNHKKITSHVIETGENKHAGNQGTSSDEHDFPTLDTYVEKQSKEPVGVTQ